MKAKDLIEKLSNVEPDTEIVGGMFNGRVETYKVLTDGYKLRSNSKIKC